MDFEEFLWANAVTDQQIALLKSHFIQRKPLPSFLHEKMMEYLRYYMVIGGMPEVVNTYTQTHNLFAADQIHRTIYRDYLFDIDRFAHSDVKIKAENCYKSIPLQLSKENHKFQYKIVEHKGTARKFESSLDWLENAHFIKLIYNVSTLAYPLESFSICLLYTSAFKHVPTAVAPMLTAFKSLKATRIRLISRPTIVA